MKIKYILFFYCLFPLHVTAQQIMNLSACIAYGLKNNRNIVIYENERKIADAKTREALADYLPKLGLTGTFDDNLKVQQSVIPAGIFGPNDLKIAFTQRYNTNGFAQVDQTLYDHALLTSLKAGRYNKQQADLNSQKNEEAIIYNISNAYCQYYVYREQLSLLSLNTTSYKKQLEICKLQVEKGIKPEKDLDKVSVDYNNSLSQIRVAESSLELASNQLKFEMGFPMNNQLRLDTVPQISLQSLDTEARPSSFHAEKRIEYQLAEIDLKLLGIDLSRIKAEAFPKLTGYARYGAVGFGQTLSPAFKDLNPYSAIGLKLTIPLLDFFKRGSQYNQAKYKQINAAENLKLDESKYHLEYENARTKMIKAQVNVENDLQNLALARSVFKTTDLQYEKGATDLTDWLNAQNAIRESQNNYLNSLYSFYQAKIDFEKSSGTLKTFYTSL